MIFHLQYLFSAVLLYIFKVVFSICKFLRFFCFVSICFVACFFSEFSRFFCVCLFVFLLQNKNKKNETSTASGGGASRECISRVNRPNLRNTKPSRVVKKEAENNLSHAFITRAKQAFCKGLLSEGL